MQFNNQTTWEKSFESQIGNDSYNTAPVDVIVRNVSYYLRNRYSKTEIQTLKFLEIGCGGGINLIWLAKKGIKISGIDISEVALELCKKNLTAQNLPYENILHASATDLPFDNDYFNGIVESCVIQHIDDAGRQKTFEEIYRTLKPGGLFVGHVLDKDCTAFNEDKSTDGSIVFQDKTKPAYYLTNIGYAHFFDEEELKNSLSKFSVVDLSKVIFSLPKEEANRRGYESYQQVMWSIYAIK